MVLWVVNAYLFIHCLIISFDTRVQEGKLKCTLNSSWHWNRNAMSPKACLNRWLRIWRERKTIQKESWTITRSLVMSGNELIKVCHKYISYAWIINSTLFRQLWKKLISTWRRLKKNVASLITTSVKHCGTKSVWQWLLRRSSDTLRTK